MIHPLTQKVVILKVGIPKLVDQRLILFRIRVEPKLEGLIDYHHHYFSTDVLVFKGVFIMSIP